MPAMEYPYEGTIQELEAIDMELVDNATQMQELRRLRQVLDEHRQRVIKIMYPQVK